MSHDDLANLQTYDIEAGLELLDTAQIPLPRGRKDKEFEPLFWPDNYLLDGHDMTLANNELTQDQLAKYGKKISQFR